MAVGSADLPLAAKSQLQTREQAGCTYNGAVFEIKKEIPF
jgi:hypothetical protein